MAILNKAELIAGGFNEATDKWALNAGIITASEAGLPIDQVSDSLPALNAALARSDVKGILLSPITYKLSGQLVIPANKKIITIFGKATLKLNNDVSGNPSSVVRLQDGAEISDVVIDGSISERYSAGNFSGVGTRTWGIHVLNASKTRARRFSVIDCGSSLEENASNSNQGGNGGAYSIEVTIDAVSDCFDNIAEDFTSNCPQAGFVVRLLSPFKNYGEGDYTPRVFSNKIGKFTAYGGIKNAVELVGPNTQNNEVEDFVIYDYSGFGGAETDFGAKDNIFRRGKFVFSSDFILPRTISIFRQGTTYESDNKPKHTRGTVFEDCQVQGGIQSGTNYRRAFYLDAGTNDAWTADVKFIRCKDDGATSAVGASSDRCHSLTINISDGSILGKVEVIDCNFKSSEVGIRVVGTGGYVEELIVSGGYISGSSYCYRNANTVINGNTGYNVKSVMFCNGVTVYTTGTNNILFTNERIIRIFDIRVAGTPSSTGIVSPANGPGSTMTLRGVVFDLNETNQFPFNYTANCQLVDQGGHTFVGRAPGAAVNGSGGRLVSGRSSYIGTSGNSENMKSVSKATIRRENTSFSSGATFERGDEILRRTGLNGSSLSPGWLCVLPGTAGTLSSVTGSTTAGSNIVTVSDVSNIPLGSYITIDGESPSVMQVITRNTSTNIITVANEDGSTISFSGVSAAAVSFVAPTWRALPNVAAS